MAIELRGVRSGTITPLQTRLPDRTATTRVERPPIELPKDDTEVTAVTVVEPLPPDDDPSPRTDLAIDTGSPVTAAEVVEEGDGLFARGFIEPALKAYCEAMEMAEKGTAVMFSALRGTARSLANLRKIGKAWEICQSLARYESSEPRNYLVAIEVLCLAGQPAKAKQVLEFAQKKIAREHFGALLEIILREDRFAALKAIL